MAKPIKRLYRSKKDKVIGGVCGGISRRRSGGSKINLGSWLLDFYGRWSYCLYPSLDYYP